MTRSCLPKVDSSLDRGTCIGFRELAGLSLAQLRECIGLKIGDAAEVSAALRTLRPIDLCPKWDVLHCDAGDLRTIGTAFIAAEMCYRQSSQRTGFRISNDDAVFVDFLGTHTFGGWTGNLRSLWLS